MKIDIRIMGVEKRLPLIRDILARTGLPESCVVLDDRGFAGAGSAWYTAKKAWLAPLPEGTTHRLVLQDDADVCDNFIGLVNKCVGKFPNVAWTFYSATWITPDMKKHNSPYIRIRGCRVGGVALLLPVEHIQRMIDWSDGVFGEDFKHDDARVGWYCAYNAVPMFTTIPSLSEHKPVDTCIPHHHRKDRVAKTWIGRDVSNQNWDSVHYSESPIIVNHIWLPKDHPRWPQVNAMVERAKARVKLNL